MADGPSVPTRVDQLVDFPFDSFDELQRSIRDGSVALAPDQNAARNLAGGGSLGERSRIVSLILSWSWLWGTLPLIAIAWQQIGPAALVMLPVGWVSLVFNRPWRGWLTVVALAVTVAAGATGALALAWGGAAWLLVWFLSNVWHRWSTAQFKGRLSTDELYFASAFHARLVGLRLKGSRDLLLRELTDTELQVLAEKWKRVSK